MTVRSGREQDRWLSGRLLAHARTFLLFAASTTFVVSACSGGGGSDRSGIAQAADDEAECLEDGFVEVPVLSNDAAGVSLRDFTQPASGVVTTAGSGALRYTPVPFFHGIDTFFYVVELPGSVATARVTVTVSHVNHPPSVESAFAVTSYRTPVLLDVLGSVVDPDDDPLSVGSIVVTTGDSAELQVDGRVLYEPGVAVLGQRAFTFSVDDGAGGATTGTAHVFVRPPPLLRVDVGSGGAGNAAASAGALSTDGSRVAFGSGATNLIPADGNAFVDAFLRDRTASTTERASVSSSGVPQNQSIYSGVVAVNGNGTVVAFDTYADNLVPGDSFGTPDLFVRDLVSGTTSCISVTTGGQPSGSGMTPSISSDGRIIAFQSNAANLVAGRTTSGPQVFARDRQTGVTELVSMANDGTQGANGIYIFGIAISADGNHIAFASSAPGLTPGDTNARGDIFLRDRQQGTIERVSVGDDESEGNGDSFWPSVSANGRFVLFTSESSNLVPGDTNAADDVFLRDRQLGTTRRVSVATGGGQANGDSWTGEAGATLSSDGRFAVFESYAANLGDGNDAGDIYVHDVATGRTTWVSSFEGVNGDCGSFAPAISPDGTTIVFVSCDTQGQATFAAPPAALLLSPNLLSP